MKTDAQKQISAGLASRGLSLRGGFHLQENEDLYKSGFRSVQLVGNLGGEFWQHFMANKRDDVEHPLDEWTVRSLSAITDALDCEVLYPFDGPPYYPFVSWGRRAENLKQGPIGILVHPIYGLWHGYRGALLWREPLILPQKTEVAHPCDTCVEKPCLRICPIQAVSEKNGLDFVRCRSYLEETQNEKCLSNCCQARRDCIIGGEYSYSDRQSRYHTQRFMGHKVQP